MRSSPLKSGSAMKVIFLDVDGVLNDDATFQQNFILWKTLNQREKANAQLQPHLIERLRCLVLETSAGIVISSSWRRTAWRLEALQERLRIEGMPILGCTPFASEAADILGLPYGMSSYPGRDIEIEAWLRKHPEVTHYVIFDDQDIHTHGRKSPVHEHWIRTVEALGLTDADIEKAKKWLK